MRRIPLIAFATLVVLAIIGVYLTQAFTAANTVPDSNAGSGSGTVSGYTISNIDYNLNSTDAEDIDSVEFDIDPTTADTVVVKLDAQQYSCGVVAGHATCDTTSPQATVAPLASLTVISSD